MIEKVAVSLAVMKFKTADMDDLKLAQALIENAAVLLIANFEPKDGMTPKKAFKKMAGRLFEKTEAAINEIK